MNTQSASKLNNFKRNKSELWTPYKNAITERQRLILQALMYEGTDGLTWKQLGKILNLHHGQISGALNGLHQLELVFMLRTKKDGCHLYVSHLCRNQFADEQVYDAPPPNKGKQRRQLLDELFTECLDIRASGSNDYNTSAISDLLDQIIVHDGNKKPKKTVTKSKPQSKLVVATPMMPVSKKPRGTQASVEKRVQAVYAKIAECQASNYKEVICEHLAIFTGYSMSDVYYALRVLKDSGKIGYQYTDEPKLKGIKIACINKWDETISHFVAK